MQNVIIAFGDSTTAPRHGIKVYAELLPSALAETGISAVLANAGVPGNTTAMARERFERDVVELSPTLVIIQFGINDSTVDVWHEPPTTAPRVSLNFFRENLTFFVETLRGIHASVILMTPNQLRWTPQLQQLYGKPPYDPEDIRGMTPGLSSYAKGMRLVAVEQGIPLIDVFSYYDQFEEDTDRSCSELLLDGLHPNQLGHDLIAKELTSLIQKLMFGSKQ